MGFFLRKYGKWIAIGLVATIVVIAGLLVFRVLNFIGDVQATRVGDAIATPDSRSFAQATATAQARLCAASAECTASPGTVLPNITPVITPMPTAMLTPTATPDVSNSKIVQRIKAGERISIMYMGYGGPGHEGEYLTDTILVMSFDPKTGTVTQFNIPRDLYVAIPAGPGGKPFNGKVNGILSTLMKWEKPTQDELDPKYRFTNPQEQQAAGANLAANTIQNILGFKIDYWITMNFEAFRTLIDKMGGVTVCVDRAFVDNQYPRNDDDQVDASVMTIKFDAGCQLMNGERAIQFSRSRKSESLEGGDFARSARQMKVIAAIKDEIMKKNLIGNALGYMDALQGNLRVSMDPGEMFALANFFNSSEGKSIISTLKFDPEILTVNFLQEVDKGGAIGYALIPKAGESKYADIQAWVKSNFTYSLIRRDNARLQVLNASGISGKGGALTDFLYDQGFRMSETDVASLEDETYLVDYTNGAAVGNINQLKQFLPNMKVYTKTADKKPYDNAPELILFLGKNYKGVTTSTITSTGQGGGVPAPTTKP